MTEENVPIMKKTTAITEEMKSYTLDPSGPILKFSDMFIAPEPRRIFPRRRKGPLTFSILSFTDIFQRLPNET